MQAQQTAQGPEDIDRAHAIAQNAKAEAGTGQYGQKGEQPEGKGGTLTPVTTGFDEAVTLA